MNKRVQMNRQSKNIALIGSVLAFTFFLIGLVHNELLAGCLLIADTVSGDNPIWLYPCWMTPIAVSTVALMEWKHRRQRFLN